MNLNGRTKDLTGQRFGRLVVREYIGSKDKGAMWLCDCDCGKEKIMSSKNILTNKVRSCGCLKEKGFTKGDVVKGACGNRLYKVYKSMIHRCYYPNEREYKHYGGKGVRVCNEWLNDFYSFERWALENGYDINAPFGKCTLDRIDVNGNYEPSNCRWVNIKTQLNNTTFNVKITANGKTMTIAEWARELGVNVNTLYSRCRRRWSDERIINTPVGKYTHIRKR